MPSIIDPNVLDRVKDPKWKIYYAPTKKERMGYLDAEVAQEWLRNFVTSTFGEEATVTPDEVQKALREDGKPLGLVATEEVLKHAAKAGYFETTRISK